jgi:hypothetical protein
MIRIPSILLMLLSLVGCIKNDCSNELITEIISPDGAKKIVLFSRNCGATTGFNCQATILDTANELPDKVGTTFIIGHGSAITSWIDNTKVLVILEPSVRLFKKEFVDHGVCIEYQTRSKVEN